jgi:integrase
MARPRKDGQPTRTAFRTGKPRTTANGKAWRVRAYQPTTGAPHGRVIYWRPDGDMPTSSVPEVGETLDELFERIERALDVHVSPPHERIAPGTARRDIKALGELYLEWLRNRDCSPEYVRNRACLLHKWIEPVIGTVLVADWSPEHTQTVRTHAAATVGAGRLEDLGSTLSGMRRVARLKRPGGRWLAPDDDPLEEVSFARGARIQGAHRNFVPKHMRPSTDSVKAVIEAAGEQARWAWMAQCVSLAGFCAPRLGEQLGLRAIDIDLEARVLDVNGTWKVGPAPEKGAPRPRERKPHPKNRLRRTTPYLGSQHTMLVALCRMALALDTDSSEAEVAATIAAERAQRAQLSPTGDWRDLKVPLADEPWLFPDETGLPPTREAFNTAWHGVRDRTAWNPAIPYKNLRHHSVMYWHDELGIGLVTIADWDGHDHRTLQAFYILPVETATAEARATLDTH